jgi:hypothetical protein
MRVAQPPARMGATFYNFVGIISDIKSFIIVWQPKRLDYKMQREDGISSWLKLKEDAAIGTAHR